MATVFIANLAVTLPSRFAEGDILGDNAAKVLQAIWLKRIANRLRDMLNRGELDGQTIQLKADVIAREELTPYTLADDDDEGAGDVVMQEALALAKGLIVSRMAQEGLPPPKGLDNHARALVDAMPDLVERARLRVEARHNAATAALGLNL